jgi:c-di-GMP-binding flagellar brake protein YcgR
MTLHTAYRRQHKRRSIDVRVQLVISQTHLAQVAPVNGAAVAGRLTNVSGGGAHAVVATYLPRGTQVDVEIPAEAKLPAGRLRARVMTVRMVDREPRYGVGLRFEDPESELAQALQAAEEEEAGK